MTVFVWHLENLANYLFFFVKGKILITQNKILEKLLKTFFWHSQKNVDQKTLEHWLQRYPDRPKNKLIISIYQKLINKNFFGPVLYYARYLLSVSRYVLTFAWSFGHVWEQFLLQLGTRLLDAKIHDFAMISLTFLLPVIPDKNSCFCRNSVTFNCNT